MRVLSPHRSFIALLRGSSRLAALVLVLFLTGVAINVACADHDLADAGVGQHQDHMSAPDGTNSGGAGVGGYADGHCGHSGGTHAPAIPSVAVFSPVGAADVLVLAETPARPSALSQRELRPPIL